MKPLRALVALIAICSLTIKAQFAVAQEANAAAAIPAILREHCHRCHNAEVTKSGVRLDQLSIQFLDNEMFLWKDVLKQISDGTMPPEGQSRLTKSQRESLAKSIRDSMNEAMARNTHKNGSVRRLTVSQYRNTIRQLLGLKEDLTVVLPPDGLSKDGFNNNGQVLGLSPLQMEYYFDIAQKALDLCLVDEDVTPVIQNFRVSLGRAINPNPCPDKLILGADSLLLENDDFVVTELKPIKTFDYKPFAMRTKYDFLEGYEGNSTVRGWKKYDSLYHAVYACMRGSHGYPLGEAYQVVEAGLLLRPAIPSSELFGQSSTYGPRANFKISLRELPESGDFRVKVRAARYEDALLLVDGVTIPESSMLNERIVELSGTTSAGLDLDLAGIYRVDAIYSMHEEIVPGGANKTEWEKRPKVSHEMLHVDLGDRGFARQIPVRENHVRETNESGRNAHTTPLMLVRLHEGWHRIGVKHGKRIKIHRLNFRRVKPGSEEAENFERFEKRRPLLGVHLGLRRDCGSTLKPVGQPVAVSSQRVEEFVFEGAINDFPNPHVEKDNVNYLAGIREIGVRSEYTDGREMPRLLIESVEFEGPIYETWPPENHRNLIVESGEPKHSPAHARQAITRFLERAYRRPANREEVNAIVNVWEEGMAENGDYQRSFKDALTVALTSPQFLFLCEKSEGPEAEDLESFELASKLAYFLWNSPPDERLMLLAGQGQLQKALDVEVARMIGDPRFLLFIEEFGSQWLSLDKFDVVEVDGNRYPRLTRDTRTQLRKEPIHFLRYLVENNLPLRNIVHSEFIMANETVADYYDLGNKVDSGFDFVPVPHARGDLGGFLTQASILTGLSNGRESNPVKRGAWLARKIIAEPPADPPPNVPELKEDDNKQLSLREKLELHRGAEACAKCHEGIDPWGIAMEGYDAGGRLKKEMADSRAELPDGTKVEDLQELKRYLANDRIDRIAFSFLKHLACYANGRSLTYNEVVFLENESIKFKADEYPIQDLIRFIVKSDLFLKK